MAAGQLESDGDLRAWIREHRVRWESGPALLVHRHETIAVGLTLTLSATPPEESRFQPGDEACAAVFQKLRGVLEAVVPEGSRVRIEPFDGSFRLLATGGWDPEVELSAEILHGETFEPVDDVERGQLAAIARRLAALGVRPRTREAFGRPAPRAQTRPPQEPAR
jgi:hypothetical protein